MLDYVLPILTEAWQEKGRGGGEVQNDRQCLGLLPPIFGGRKIAPSFFFEFWARGLGVQTPYTRPLTTVEDKNERR